MHHIIHRMYIHSQHNRRFQVRDWYCIYITQRDKSDQRICICTFVRVLVITPYIYIHGVFERNQPTTHTRQAKEESPIFTFTLTQPRTCSIILGINSPFHTVFILFTHKTMHNSSSKTSTSSHHNYRIRCISHGRLHPSLPRKPAP